MAVMNTLEYQQEEPIAMNPSVLTRRLFLFWGLSAVCLMPEVCRAGLSETGTKAPMERFEVGKGTFLLNGKPFIVKAAEVHYPRIPEAYWEHRILMCKALGMNTLCLYVFWNYHEREPGKFDFSGNGDIARFCRLAQKHGMYVIIRPGPYVCAEWEMGGLPWWLLRKDGIRLRTNDPYYLERVGLFLKAVGKELAPLQLARGGNILMVQVENEYGAYATDKAHVSAIRDMVRAAGFTDVTLFQCDWSSTFKRNGLDDLLWTINFGTGADIDGQFKNLRAARPDSPMMCSEFWSGWFDHWGRKHETRNADAMVRGIRDMLDRGISFSLYMTHGGTTFGWWGGANNPAYSAMCSSYDYDAPISEAGWVTPKYEKLRALLQKYAEAPLPEPPAPMPVITVPEFRMVDAVSVFEALPEPKTSQEIRPMESFGQGWGTILYTTRLPRAAKAGETLVIDEIHDWAQVFADGKLLARLDRRKKEFSLKLPSELPAGTRLDILVEAMGRVNFGGSIHDHKGITKTVTLGATNLKDWQMFNLPPEYAFVAAAKATKGAMPSGPAWWVGSFDLETTGDTFLDLCDWGKGMVWVNGHALGRFWEIGPQQTLFLPGCWLKKGRNEVIVLDLKGPREPVLRGLDKPILNQLRGIVSDKHRKPGQTLCLQGETPVAEGSLPTGGGWQNVDFPTVAEGRYLCLEVCSTIDPNQAAAIAELELIGADGKPLSRENWRAVYADSEETRTGNATADKVYDLQESTFWAAEPKAKCPQSLVIDLGATVRATRLRILSRAEKGAPGQVKDCRIYLKFTPFVYKGPGL